MAQSAYETLYKGLMNINEDGCWPWGLASALMVIGACEIPWHNLRTWLPKTKTITSNHYSYIEKTFWEHLFSEKVALESSKSGIFQKCVSCVQIWQKIPKGSVLNGLSKFTMCLRWFKCKLKPPTNVSQKNLSSHFETLNVKRYTVQLGTYDMITES